MIIFIIYDYEKYINWGDVSINLSDFQTKTCKAF